MTEGGCTLEDVQTKASSLGFSPRGLRRLVEQGAVGRPTRTGLGRGKGVCSLYPSDTLERLEIVATLRQARKTLAQQLVLLRARGFAVDSVTLKEALSECVLGALMEDESLLDNRVTSSDMSASRSKRGRPDARYKNAELNKSLVKVLQGKPSGLTDQTKPALKQFLDVSGLNEPRQGEHEQEMERVRQDIPEFFGIAESGSLLAFNFLAGAISAATEEQLDSAYASIHAHVSLGDFERRRHAAGLNPGITSVAMVFTDDDPNKVALMVGAGLAAISFGWCLNGLQDWSDL